MLHLSKEESQQSVCPLSALPQWLDTKSGRCGYEGGIKDAFVDVGQSGGGHAG